MGIVNHGGPKKNIKRALSLRYVWNKTILDVLHFATLQKQVWVLPQGATAGFDLEVDGL